MGRSSLGFNAKKKKMMFLEEQEDNTELLPGLPNDVTVQHICTKLPWGIFHVLLSVSRVWFGAIRSGEINDTRVRCGTAETLAFMECVIPDTDGYRCAMALYSLRDKAFYRLPTLPPFKNLKFALRKGCITVGGKVYVLGARDTEVWVLDVTAGQKKWQECASMQTLRRSFGCALFEGKIYIFGGYNERYQPIDFSEVYDPKVDAWTKISPMKSSRIDHDAWAVRDEIVVHTGYVYDPDYNVVAAQKFKNWRRVEISGDSMEAYNPAKDSWRTIPPGDFAKYKLVGWPKERTFFTAHGRLHSLSQRKILIIDLDQRSVQGLHTCSVESRASICNRQGPFWPDQVLATNDGLLVKGRFDCTPPFDQCRLFQSGPLELGIGEKKILFEEIECSPLVRFIGLSLLQPIQL